MKFNRYLQNLDAKSHNDEIYVLLTKEMKCGREIAQVSRKPFQKKNPHEISIKVKNLISNPKVLELEQYYSWVEVILHEGLKSHKVAIKIKESNLFDLIENSELHFREIKQNSLIFIFYKSSEIYLCPELSYTAMKAYSIKSGLEVKHVDIKPNHVYKLKSGKLAIHLEKTSFSQVDFSRVQGVRTKDLHIFLKTDCYTMRELKGQSFTGRNIGASITNPYISEEGQFKLDEKESEKFIGWGKEGVTGKECSSIGLYDKGKQLINNEILFYLESFDKLSVGENTEILEKDLSIFMKDNLGTKFSSLKSFDKAKASLLQAYILHHYLAWGDSFTFDLEKVLNIKLSKILLERDEKFLLPYDSKKEFFLFSEEKEKMYLNWSRYPVSAEYSICGKSLKVDGSLELFRFIKDLLTMKDLGFI